MRSLRFLLYSVVISLIGSLGLSAADFEGTITMAIKEGRQTQNLTYATKAGKLRVSMQGGAMGEMNAIIDVAGGKIIVLMTAQGMYMEMPLSGPVQEAINERAPTADRMKRTDEMADILGYPCRKYIFDEAEGPIEIWATDQLGQFVALPQGNPMQPAAAKESWDQFIAGDFFPLRIVALNTKGKERMRWEVTKITPQTLAPTLFEIPAGLRKFDMGAMMQGLGGLLGN
jgi:hypothetical protein